MTPALWLKRSARIFPEAPAVYHGADLIWNYASFEQSVARVSAALRGDHGIKPGDRIAIYLSNRTEYLELMYAVWYAGAVVVPINYKLHPREVSWMVNNCAARMVFCDREGANEMTALLDAEDAVIVDVDSASYASLREAPPSPITVPVPRKANDLAWLFYTSGTTGRPKGVMLSNANLMSMTLSYFVDIDAVCTEDAALYAAPMSHGAGLYNFAFVMKGARHVIPPSGGFDGREVEVMAKLHGNISMFAAPTMVRRMVRAAADTGYDGTGLKTIVYGGGPMYVVDILEALERLGPRFVQIYGQGESPMTITALSRDLVADRSHQQWQSRLASVGMPQSSVDVIIADSDGSELPTGEVGEILVSGTPVMMGYWNNPEATRAAIKDGWLWTGDLGTMDADGFVTLSDRSKDVIISGGTNIYPREVEETLLTHLSVHQVSVVGKPDPEWGEVVVAFVVLETGCTFDESLLDAHCLKTIARFKRPKEYVFLEELPQNSYGKVLKTELRKRFGVRQVNID